MPPFPSPTAIGIDIGGTKLCAAWVDRTGAILEHRSEPTSRQPAMLAAQILSLLQQLDRPPVAAIGIGVPGRVAPDRRTVLSGGYVDLTGFDLAGRLEQACGRPVVLDNDCTMALLGEMAVGGARGEADVAMLTIGTGIGGALVLNGEIVRGKAGAGQFGHVTVASPGEPCACGRRGCVETTSSGSALRRWIAEAGLDPSTTAQELFEREARGDAAARQVLHAWIGPLRLAIDSIVAAVDPSLVLLGGGLGEAAHRALRRLPAASPWFQCRVEAAMLGDRAGVIGCALTALDGASLRGVPERAMQGP
ncbi:ROK family protein [Labrys monachus]|uniref:Glucokinase n=1 Tax=Labrys monachus TaxID=217067 RepID=A0ABU0FI47_9HYPH|nr:ROK family protein [Labrys monachus]MDQ0394282.1 glucokinase [Labrys monachus]